MVIMEKNTSIKI